MSNDEVGESMAGPAIRAYELARQVAREHNTVVRTPTRLLEMTPEGCRDLGAAARLGRCLKEVDVVVTNTVSARLVGAAARRGTRIVVDAYDPVLFEALEADQGLSPVMRRSRAAVRLAQLRLAARVGDAFICANDRQRDLLMGTLAVAGRIRVAEYDSDPTLRGLVDTVPFGLPDVEPVRKGPGLREMCGLSENDFVLVWGGGIWDWFDPLTLIRAIASIAEHRTDVKLVFLGVAHPRPGFPRHRRVDETIDLSRQLGVLDKYVFVNRGWVPYHKRADYLLDANAGVSANHVHLESRYAFRTRVLDYLWCELPVICTAGDAIADLVQREGLGLTVPAGDVEGFAAAIERLADDADLRDRVGQGLRRVRTSYSWPQVSPPLLRLVSSISARRGIPRVVRARRMLAAAQFAFARATTNHDVIRLIVDRLWRRHRATL